MAPRDRWHFTSEAGARRAGVTEHCKCKGRRYPTRRHGEGLQWFVEIPGHGTKSFELKGEAADWEEATKAQLKAQQQDAAPLPDPKIATITVQELWDKYRENRRVTGGTPKQYEGLWNRHLRPRWAPVQFRAIDEDDAASWLVKLRKTRSKYAPYTVLSPGTVADIWDLFLALMNLGARKTGRPSPCTNVAYPKPPDKPDLIPWQPAFVDTVLTGMGAGRPIGDLAAFCGLRQGEAFGIGKGDIRFLQQHIVLQHQIQHLDGTLRLVPVKNEDVRTVPLAATVANRLSAHLAGHPTLTMTCECHGTEHELLFHHNTRPLGKDAWNDRVWKPAVRAAKLTPTHTTGLHQLRHFYASQLLFDGVSMYDVAKFLGDSHAVTEKTYAHLVDASYGRARKIMERLASGARLGEAEADHG